jgi:hypothetical protein
MPLTEQTTRLTKTTAFNVLIREWSRHERERRIIRDGVIASERAGRMQSRSSNREIQRSASVEFMSR